MSNLNGQDSTFTVLFILAYLVLAATDAASTLLGMGSGLAQPLAGGRKISRFGGSPGGCHEPARHGFPRSSKDIVLTIKHCCCLNHLGFPQPQR